MKDFAIRLFAKLDEILSKVVYGKKAHPRLITAKQLVLVAPPHR